MQNSSQTRKILGALIAFCLSCSLEAQATVTPYVAETAGFSNYTILSDLSKTGNFNLNQSVVNGNLGLINSSFNSSNNDTINGDVSYTSSSFSINSSVHITGNKQLDLTLSTASSQAAVFSKTIADFTPTQILTRDLNQGATLVSTSDINVVNLASNNVNGTVTLVGDSNDLFYINVSGHLNISKIVLDGVAAQNVYWNIIGGKNANLSGALYGTFLAYNSQTSQATSLNINNATLEGNIYGGSMNISNSTINGVPLSEALEAPEANSVFAISLFGAFLLGGSLKRYWNRRRSLQPEAA